MNQHRESYMRVSAQQTENKKFQVKVELYSDIKPRAISNHILDLDRFSSFQECSRAVEAAGGALAEHQNVTLGDNHDPSNCAEAAVELFKELIMSQDSGVRH